MELFQYNSDILLSYDTDIDFSMDDILLTNGLDFLKRKVFKLLITEFTDWKMDPTVGASPNKFTGEKNTRAMGQIIKQYMESKIQPYIYPAVIDVKVVPIDYDSIKIYLDLIVATDIVSTIPFTLDFINGISYTQYDDVVDKLISNSTNKINHLEDINNPNPYLDRLRLQ